ncbi:MAG TPA: hypothetical protein VFE32_19105 [Puia sp.]|jgi:hypothetical protein|nr:hypothetical protein [Puia sp.]
MTTKENESAGRERPANRSAADTRRTSGRSMPAVPPFQLVKINHFAPDGTQLDTDEPTEIINYVTGLLKREEFSVVELLIADLKKVGDGKSKTLVQEIEGIVVKERQTRGKESLEGKAQTGDKLNQSTPGPILEAFRTRNVVIAGESHGKAGAAEMEKKVWGKHGIEVKYESESIKDKEKGNVNPDPPALRMLYFIEDFYELLLQYKANGDKLFLQLADVSYNRCVRERSNYTPDVIKASLKEQGDPISYAQLVAYPNIMFETLELAEKMKFDALFKEDKVSGPARLILGLLDEIKEKRHKASDKPIVREMRSEAMFRSLQGDLKTASKTIYKVGNNHIVDIGNNADLAKHAWIFTEEQYLKELGRQAAMLK